MTYLHFDKTKLINLEYSLKREIIRTNRSGAYACTTIIDCNTRKYHGLLICPLPDLDGGRHVLLSGLDETIIQQNKEFNLGLHKYAGDIYEPKGHKYIHDFSSSPIPKLEYRVGDVVFLKEKILVENESQILIKYTLTESKNATKIKIKPFLAFRNIHALSKSNLDINTKYTPVKNGICSRLYSGYPDLFLQLSKKAEFIPAPDWNFNIEYNEDMKRGYEYKEDLYVPGYFEVPIKKGESIVFSASLNNNNPAQLKRKFSYEIKKRIPRNSFSTCLANTVQQFFINNKYGLNIIAGFPWHSIRSRDMAIALPGLTMPFNDKAGFLNGLKTLEKQFDGNLINDILYENKNGQPIDIPLWFIWSVQQYSIRYGKKTLWKQFGNILQIILSGYLIEKEIFKVEKNGLLYSLNELYSNSWMNASYNNKPLINRRGYLVETNALWYNAVNFILEFKDEIKNINFIETIEALKLKIENSYLSVFWNEDINYLNDFVFEGKANTQLRANQVFAASLPYSLLNVSKIKSVLEVIKSQLLTDFGIRTLTPADSEYVPKYKGDHLMREKAAFNGSVWPWLLTPYFEALLKIQPESAIRNSKRYLKNFEDELRIDGVCSISELYHGNPPQKAKGAISFAMNTGELIRLKYLIDNLEV